MELKDLKVGDLVVVTSRYGEKLFPISKITNTQIIVIDRKFRKGTGSQISSDTWNRIYISVPTEDDIKRIKNEMAKRKIKNVIIGFAEFVKRDNVSFDKMEKVYDLIVSFDK